MLGALNVIAYRKQFVVLGQSLHHLFQSHVILEDVVAFSKTLLVTALDIVSHSIVPVTHTHLLMTCFMFGGMVVQWSKALVT